MDQKDDAQHIENSPHEAILTGVIALASLFSNCVEAFGLIHPPAHKERRDQILLTRLGIQQARLLIWGDVVGVSSPPTSVTDRHVPKYPSPAYPDLTEPTFFGPRDPRLDEPQTRTTIEAALNALADRSAGLTREQMMDQFGLKPPKGMRLSHEPALDTVRLEGFREKYELLQEVAESYAQINTRRSKSIVEQAWQLADPIKFAEFLKLVQSKVDTLIDLMDVKERVDRAMRIDIRSFGWHMIDDRSRSMQDKLKLGLINDACKGEYPEYQVATQQALEQISRELRERLITKLPDWTINPYEKAEADAAAGAARQKRPSFFKMFRSFNKSKEDTRQPVRKDSDTGPLRSASDAGPGVADEDGYSEPIRSKSLGHILEPTGSVPGAEAEENNFGGPSGPIHRVDTRDSTISRHDQFSGLGRVPTQQ
ncbi:hypothetical protein AMS68_003427 [Peltaster fructicola]|uniref:Prion-inhibition and propagation HeLo domain-containing protein n=1 Tax=Peltaster fructicola TaxID=286661 RepID=A0A6H0XTX9_9PEZI|nr:hypothetical protein AMS68_003427 [Peltaster fructicola]